MACWLSACRLFRQSSGWARSTRAVASGCQALRWPPSVRRSESEFQVSRHWAVARAERVQLLYRSGKETRSWIPQVENLPPLFTRSGVGPKAPETPPRTAPSWHAARGQAFASRSSCHRVFRSRSPFEPGPGFVRNQDYPDLVAVTFFSGGCHLFLFFLFVPFVSFCLDSHQGVERFAPVRRWSRAAQNRAEKNANT